MKLLTCVLLFLAMQACNTRATIERIDLYSHAMDRELPVAVVLPQSYLKGQIYYPVIYLLHGATGNHTDWLERPVRKGLIQQLADGYDIIFVLPEGEAYSFYLDSPWNEDSQFETFIAREVVSYIDERYRTVADPSARAITGLSMGGHGALYLSARNPGVFGLAGSMSGAVDLDMDSWELPAESRENFMRQVAAEVGPEHLHPVFMADHSVVNMVSLMKENQMPLIIDCGVDDFLIEANRKLNRRLLEAGVPHDYIERPGRHDWAYWTNALLYQVLFMSEAFEWNSKKTRQPPS